MISMKVKITFVKKREMKKYKWNKKLKWEKIVTGAVITLWLCCSGQERWKWFSCPRNVLLGTVPISSVTMAMAINWLLEAIEASIPAADKLGKDLSYFPRPLYPPFPPMVAAVTSVVTSKTFATTNPHLSPPPNLAKTFSRRIQSGFVCSSASYKTNQPANWLISDPGVWIYNTDKLKKAEKKQ